MITTPRPGADQYAPSCSGYVARVAERGHVVAVLASQLEQVVARLASIPESRGDYRHAPDKRSIKEVVDHLSDAE